MLNEKFNKKQTDASIEQNHGNVKPYHRPVVDRFVPPNFDKNRFLDEHKHANSASRLVSNPFTYPVALIGNLLSSIGRAVASAEQPNHIHAIGRDEITSSDGQPIEQNESLDHTIPTEDPEISEKIGIVFVHSSSAPRHQLSLAWAFRAFYLPVRAASWPLASIRKEREREMSACSGNSEDLAGKESSGDGHGLGSAVFDTWTRLRNVLRWP